MRDGKGKTRHLCLTVAEIFLSATESREASAKDPVREKTQLPVGFFIKHQTTLWSKIGMSTHGSFV